MKALFALVLVGLPAGAQAMGMRMGMGGGGMGGYPHGGGAHGAVALYALLAALGYWVMQHAGKQEGKCTKRTGITVGTTLVIIGLLGVLCGVGSHIKSSMHSCKCQVSEAKEGEEEERVIVTGGKQTNAPMQVNVKVTKTKKTN